MQNYWDSAFERVPSTKVRDGLSYERTKNVWNELKQNPDNFNKDGSLNIDKVYENLSPAEKKVFNEIDNYNKIINEYVEMAAIKHGRIHNPINEYDFFHESYEIGGIKSNPETFLQNLESSYQSPTKQAGSTYDRDMGARIIRTDIDNVIKKQLEQVAHDMYVRDNLLSTWRSLDNAAKEVEGFDMITEALKTTMGERLIRAEGKEMLQGDTKSLDNLMTYMSYKFLGRVGRIPQELISNVDRALISEFSKDVVSNVEPVYQNMLTDYIVDTKDYSQFSENLSKTTNLGKKGNK